MRLYIAAGTDYAVQIIESGFGQGTPSMQVDDEGRYTGQLVYYVEFHDMPRTGLAFSRTTETSVESDGANVNISLSGGAVFMDDPVTSCSLSRFR
jgi:hypothetical protein